MTDRTGHGHHNPPTPIIERAATALRNHVDPGWYDARTRIRSAALAATRRTWPLALRAGPGLYVSDQVIIARLRQIIDDIEHVHAHTILITPRDEPAHVVEIVTIEISIDFNWPIHTLAETVREAAGAALDDLLAPIPTPTGQPQTPIDLNVVTVHQHQDQP